MITRVKTVLELSSAKYANVSKNVDLYPSARGHTVDANNKMIAFIIVAESLKRDIAKGIDITEWFGNLKILFNLIEKVHDGFTVKFPNSTAKDQYGAILYVGTFFSTSLFEEVKMHARTLNVEFAQGMDKVISTK